MRPSGQLPLILSPCAACPLATLLIWPLGVESTNSLLARRPATYPTTLPAKNNYTPIPTEAKLKMCFCVFFQNKIISATALSPWLLMPSKVTKWGQTQPLASLRLFNRNPFLKEKSCCGMKKTAEARSSAGSELVKKLFASSRQLFQQQTIPQCLH